LDDLTGKSAELAHRLEARSAIAAPIMDEGRVWGTLLVGSTRDQAFPPRSEHRLAAFTELVATSIGNADAHAELVSSRARIVAAGDEARRRIERNLHDTTQQQLIALGLELQTVRAAVPPDLTEAHQGFGRMEGEIQAVLEEVRELSRGLHPALLTRRGLEPALRALARRSPVPIDLSIELDERPPEPVETGVYYLASEAMTNIAKHAQATSASIDVAATETTLRVSVTDDGVGGATISPGSGLAGLVDRVEALGGRLELDSPPDRGTRLVAVFALGAPMPQPAPREVQPVFVLDEHLEAIAAAGEVIDSAGDDGSLYVVDQVGRIEFVDAKGLQILGYTADELRGKPGHDTIHYKRRDGTTFLAADCPLLRPWLTGEAVTVDEDWFIAKDGSFVPVAYKAALLPLPRGRATVIAFRVRDEHST
jgi:PAS domain S-box-containing protein